MYQNRIILNTEVSDKYIKFSFALNVLACMYMYDLSLN